MNWFRIGIRLPLLLLATFGVFVAWVGFQPVRPFAPAAMRRIRRVLLRMWGYAALRIVNARVECTGAPPRPPFFLVANHLGYVDIFLLARYAGPVFVARADMETWPVFGFMMRKAQMLFIRRDQFRDAPRVVARLHEVLDAADGLAVFPEARCSRGETVLPFKPALLQAAAQRTFPVHHVTFSYDTPEGAPAAGDSVVWWRWESVGAHLVRLLSLPGFTAHVHFGAAPVICHDRKALASALHEAVLRNFVPVKQGVLEELPMPPNNPAAALYRESAGHLPAPADSIGEALDQPAISSR